MEEQKPAAKPRGSELYRFFYGLSDDELAEKYDWFREGRNRALYGTPEGPEQKETTEDEEQQ